MDNPGLARFVQCHINMAQRRRDGIAIIFTVYCLFENSASGQVSEFRTSCKIENQVYNSSS